MNNSITGQTKNLSNRKRKMIHYLDSEMAYTACFQLPDNGIIKLETTNDVDKVDCEACINAILTEWDKEATE